MNDCLNVLCVGGMLLIRIKKCLLALFFWIFTATQHCQLHNKGSHHTIEIQRCRFQWVSFFSACLHFVDSDAYHSCLRVKFTCLFALVDPFTLCAHTQRIPEVSMWNAWGNDDSRWFWPVGGFGSHDLGPSCLWPHNWCSHQRILCVCESFEVLTLVSLTHGGHVRIGHTTGFGCQRWTFENSELADGEKLVIRCPDSDRFAQLSWSWCIVYVCSLYMYWICICMFLYGTIW